MGGGGSSPKKRDKADAREQAEEFLRVGALLKDQGKLESAKAVYDKALHKYETQLGHGHPHTIKCLHQIALISFEQGKFTDAQAQFTKVIEASSKAKSLGPDHPTTFDAVYTLGQMYHKQGDLPSASQQYEKALESSTKTLGPVHPKTVSITNSYAGLMRQQGRVDQAKEMYEKVINARQKSLGIDHPSTRSVIGNLAGMMQQHDTHGQRLQEKLEEELRELGDRHARTLQTMFEIGTVDYNLGSYDQAHAGFLKVLEGREFACGVDHEDTLMVCQALGNTSRKRGDLAAAQAYYERALAGRKEALGDGHFLTASTALLVGNVMNERGDYGDAAAMLQGAVDHFVLTLRDDHKDVLKAKNALAGAMYNMGRTLEAAVLYKKVFDARLKVLGKDHVNTLTTCFNLAMALELLGRLEDAKTLFLMAVEGRSRVLGPEHPDTYAAIESVAHVLTSQGDADALHNWYIEHPVCAPDHLVALPLSSAHERLDNEPGTLDQQGSDVSGGSNRAGSREVNQPSSAGLQNLSPLVESLQLILESGKNAPNRPSIVKPASGRNRFQSEPEISMVYPTPSATPQQTPRPSTKDSPLSKSAGSPRDSHHPDASSSAVHTAAGGASAKVMRLESIKET